MERPTCATCPYFFEDAGECRRNPPVATAFLWPDATDASKATDWPTVWTGDFCGEHPRFDAYIAATRDDCAREHQP